MPFSQIFWSTFWTRSPLITDCWPLHSSSWTSVWPSLNILHHCLSVPSLLTFWPQNVHNSQWISAALMFLTWGKWILCEFCSWQGYQLQDTSQLTLQRQEQILCDQKCDNLEGNESCMWHYLAGASSPLLLQYLPKINGGCFPNSLHIHIFKFMTTTHTFELLKGERNLTHIWQNTTPVSPDMTPTQLLETSRVQI
jgi:hypothetical protein